MPKSPLSVPWPWPWVPHHSFPWGQASCRRRGLSAASAPTWAPFQVSAPGALQPMPPTARWRYLAPDSTNLSVKSNVFVFSKIVSVFKLSWDILITQEVCVVKTRVFTAYIQQMFAWCSFASSFFVFYFWVIRMVETALCPFSSPSSPFVPFRRKLPSCAWCVPAHPGFIVTPLTWVALKKRVSCFGCFKALQKWCQTVLSILPLAFIPPFLRSVHIDAESSWSLILTVYGIAFIFFPQFIYLSGVFSSFYSFAWSICTMSLLTTFSFSKKPFLDAH